MLERSTQAIENWKGFDQAIDRWLDERHHLILQISEFAANHEFSEITPSTAEKKIRDFAEILIDYISAGHFEFYQRLVAEGKEFDEKDALAKARRLLSAIEVSTQAALDFNEKYEQVVDLSDYADDLSDLAEALVVRFDAEDEMINKLHNVHTGSINAQPQLSHN